MATRNMTTSARGMARRVGTGGPNKWREPMVPNYLSPNPKAPMAGARAQPPMVWLVARSVACFKGSDPRSRMCTELSPANGLPHLVADPCSRHVREVPEEQRVDDDAKGPHVHRRPVATSTKHLRRHEWGRAVDAVQLFLSKGLGSHGRKRRCVRSGRLQWGMCVDGAGAARGPERVSSAISCALPQAQSCARLRVPAGSRVRRRDRRRHRPPRNIWRSWHQNSPDAWQ